jgi:transglutaminase-like putative cysteine protease
MSPRHRRLAPLLLPFLLLSLLPPSSGLPPSSPYYPSVAVVFRIQGDRTVSVEENCTLYLPSLYSSLTIRRTIPSENVWDLRAWCEPGQVTLESRAVEGGTELTLRISFSSPFRGNLGYGLSYRASGWVVGTGPKYEAVLGGIRIDRGGYPYESYRVTVQGPPGGTLFWYEPREASADSSSVTYSTSVGAPGSFEGVRVTFYSSPAHYRLTLIENLRNPGRESCELVMNLLLFSEGKTGFASLLSSDPPVGSLYRDEENNWYASFRLRLAPGESRRVRVELLWRTELYDPRLSPESSGTLDDLPPGLEGYTREREYWEVGELRPLSLQLAGGERNLYSLTRKLLEWEDRSITYTPTQERQGALLTLQKGTGDCDCLSDLLIALLRALGVPSRLSFGWTAGENGAGNHAWVEVYLPGRGWEPVDPTWSGGTEKYLFRMDPLHLTRGSRGLSSSDAYLSKVHYGSLEVGPEEVSLSYLSEEEAREGFLTSARTVLGLAEGVGGDDPRLGLARDKLEAAGGGDPQAALDSLRWSMEVLGERGKPLELPARIPPWTPLALGGAAICLVVALLLGLRKR